MAMQPFIFDANTSTPQELARKRALVAQIMGTGRAPRTIGEGLSALGDGIVANVLGRRADAAEKAGTEGANSLYDSIVSGITNGTPISANTVPMADAGGEVSATAPGGSIDMTGNDVYSSFIDAAKSGVTLDDGTNLALTNPYGLAALAATGKAESGFDPGNVNRTWSDPSESGQAGTAGGILSWRGPRYQALAATGDLSPAGQAKFFLQEDPALVAALNNAKSTEEAIGLMNNAWKFAGYNRPGGEAARRLAAAQGFLPSFQGGGEVASVDPQQSFNAIMPEATGGVSLSDEVADFRNTPEFMQAYPGGYTQQPLSDQQFNDRFGGDPSQAAAYAATTPQTGGQQAITRQAQQRQQLPQMEVAQATSQQDMLGGLSVQQLMQAASNPWLNENQRSVVNMLLQQKMQGMDPSRQLDMDYKRAQIDAMNRKAQGLDNDETFFGNPVPIQNQDGTISYGQIGNKGTFRPIQLGEGQSFAPPTKTIDTGTETILVDQAGNVISRTLKQNREEASQKAIGTAEGQSQAETQSEYNSITSKMPGLYQVVDRLSSLADKATYTTGGQMLDWGMKELGMDPREAAVARAEYMVIVDNQILPLLRDTFGAQFTAEEGLRLAKTLGDPDKSPTEKHALLRAFIEQKERDIQGLSTRLGRNQGGAAIKGGRSPVSIGGYTIEQVD